MRSTANVIRNLKSRIARLEKKAGPKGGPVSFSYDGMEINEGEDLLSQLNRLEDGYVYEDAYFDGENLRVRGTFSDTIRVKKKTYIEQMSELLLKNGLVIDTLEDDSIMDDLEEYTPAKNIVYGGWFLTNKDHGEYHEEFAMTADVGSYLAFDGEKWTAGIVWTGMEQVTYRSMDPEERALRNNAKSYFNNINRRPLSHRAIGNAKSDIRALKAMMKMI